MSNVKYHNKIIQSEGPRGRTRERFSPQHPAPSVRRPSDQSQSSSDSDEFTRLNPWRDRAPQVQPGHADAAATPGLHIRGRARFPTTAVPLRGGVVARAAPRAPPGRAAGVSSVASEGGLSVGGAYSRPPRWSTSVPSAAVSPPTSTPPSADSPASRPPLPPVIFRPRPRSPRPARGATAPCGAPRQSLPLRLQLRNLSVKRALTELYSSWTL